MSPLRAWLGTALLLLAGTSVHAELRLTLDSADLSPKQRQASQALLDEARASLPPRLVERLDRKIEVRWSQRLPANGYGRARRPALVELNARLLPALTDGSAAGLRTGRTHGTLRRELLATLLHELTHLYDRSRAWSKTERLLLQRCHRQAETLGGIGLPERCRGQSTRRFTLSDDPRLLDLAGWPQIVGRRGVREHSNHQDMRSPDRYELSNPREFVAVNLEYFLLDPDFPCRRPSLYRYFRNHFGWAPAGHARCPETLPYLSASRDFARQPLGRLDPARVYEVDYLFAEANDTWVSRWGHSMLRLVICAPGRPRGPQCRLDLEHHLVLSYRAFIGDVQLSSWDGLTGSYPSRLFILPLSQVVDEYTKVELRGLASVPLRLDAEARRNLVEHAVEQHWSYDGDYYFLSNNCAVETLRLLRSGTGLQALTTLDTILPNGLLELLAGRGLADRSVLDDPREALRQGYRFDSFRDRYQTMFAVLRQRLQVPQKSVEDWLTQPAEERRPWIAKADLRASAALLLLEQAAMRRQLLLAQEELKQRYLGAGRGTGSPQEPGVDMAGDTLQKILADSGFLSRPAELLDGGYGLPQAGEWQRLAQQSAVRQQRLRRLSDDLDREVRDLLLPARRAELQAGEANLARLGERLRRLHRATGGMRLP